MATLELPYPGLSDPRASAVPRGWERTQLWRRTLRMRWRREKPSQPVSVEPSRPVRPLAATDMPLIVLAHNDLKMFPSFLDHYRRLGVTRFIVLDDQSDDGSQAYLLAQIDVDLWTSTVRYREALRGRVWRELLVERYGTDRWYLNVDSDEFLVFDGSDRGRSVQDLSKYLENLGLKRCPAPMLDMYHPGPIRAAALAKDSRPSDVATHFDSDGYRFFRGPSSMNIRGGARARVFGSQVDLMKYPLLYWDDACSLGKTIHQPLPMERNFAPIFGVLLHYKIFADVKEKAEAAAAEGQYYLGAREYKRLLGISEIEGVDMKYDGSVPYSGPEDLIARGFIVASA